ncbi:MAG TPA: hypothetical protein VD902_02750 [Symbiobacteriaceae bacterium]|nr:hypothetical protein [Symbiobacteriaceae bacterium]
MQQVLKEGLSLAQQLAALPFKATRQAFRETTMSQRPLGEVVVESLNLGEGLAKLPWRLAEALVEESARLKPGPSLEQRVAALEERMRVPTDVGT